MRIMVVQIKVYAERPHACDKIKFRYQYNIQTRHLFIYFKAAYDTIVRNEDYVSMSELNFLTKRLRLTAATQRLF
jgi:hypothetical protein